MWFKTKNFKVKLQGRAGLIYEENGKSVFIDSELLTGPNFDIVIYFSSIKAWEAPYDKETLGEKERNRIKENIAKDFYKLRIDWQ